MIWWGLQQRPKLSQFVAHYLFSHGDFMYLNMVQNRWSAAAFFVIFSSKKKPDYSLENYLTVSESN